MWVRFFFFSRYLYVITRNSNLYAKFQLDSSSGLSFEMIGQSINHVFFLFISIFRWCFKKIIYIYMIIDSYKTKIKVNKWKYHNHFKFLYNFIYIILNLLKINKASKCNKFKNINLVKLFELMILYIKKLFICVWYELW